ncbi:MAG: DUF6599 family protein [Anaerolineales bacterium]
MNLMNAQRVVPATRRGKSRLWFGAPAVVLCFILLAGCAQNTTFQLTDTLPGINSLAGWKPSEKVQTYNRQTLFDYIDGASEYFFTYTFEEAATSRYEKSNGASLNAEVWQLAVAEDAYGLFSGRPGGEAVSIGGANEAMLEPGSRLVFWQDRYYVSLTAIEAATDGDLRLFAEFISKALPTGGEKPELVGRLPAEGLVPGSVKFFHLELAIQDRLWLGGENLLGLGADTDAVYAQYGGDGVEWGLLLVQYPDSARANAGLQALAGGVVENLAAADSNGTLLGAVAGQGDPDLAVKLLGKALGK